MSPRRARPITNGTVKKTEKSKLKLEAETAGNPDEPFDDEMFKCYREYKARCKQNVVMLRKYPGIEYGPEVDSALERVLEAQAALRDAALALQTQGLQAFSIWDDRFDSEARMHLIEAPWQALKQANARLSALSAWACEKAGH